MDAYVTLGCSHFLLRYVLLLLGAACYGNKKAPAVAEALGFIGASDLQRRFRVARIWAT